MKLEKVMTRDVVTVEPTASLKEAAELLVEHRISGLPVVDDRGNVVGVFTEADVLFKEQGKPDPPSWLAWFLDPLAVSDRRKLEAHTVGEAMTTPAQTIGPDQPVATAAKIMLGAGVNRLPVVASGKLVGIVTRADLVRAFTRSDAEIEAEIQDEVLRHTVAVDASDVRAEVHDGEVTLTGRVSTHGEARTVPAQVARVPGVVEVHSDLRLAEL